MLHDASCQTHELDSDQFNAFFASYQSQFLQNSPVPSSLSQQNCHLDLEGLALGSLSVGFAASEIEQEVACQTLLWEESVGCQTELWDASFSRDLERLEDANHADSPLEI